MSTEENDINWFWKSNRDPWSLKELAEWTPYPPSISNLIEQAYKAEQLEVTIDDHYKIDLKTLLQININDLNKQRPVRRRHKNTDSLSTYRKRFNFVQPLRESLSQDTPYHGSMFISDWLIKFTNGTLEPKITELTKALINGILTEGKNVDELSEALDLVEEILIIPKPTMEYLQECCARLYTKPSFLYRTVNETLRDNDQSKLTTYGPFCYLLYNYFGRKMPRRNQPMSMGKVFTNLLKLTQQSHLTVYRGEELPYDQIKRYRDSISTKFSYKWSSFISTSKSRQVAEWHSSNVLYVIQLDTTLLNDQYIDLTPISYISNEEEVLLRPGVRLKITKYDIDSITGRFVFHVQVLQSFISTIM